MQAMPYPILDESAQIFKKCYVPDFWKYVPHTYLSVVFN